MFLACPFASWFRSSSLAFCASFDFLDVSRVPFRVVVQEFLARFLRFFRLCELLLTLTHKLLERGLGPFDRRFMDHERVLDADAVLGELRLHGPLRKGQDERSCHGLRASRGNAADADVCDGLIQARLTGFHFGAWLEGRRLTPPAALQQSLRR